MAGQKRRILPPVSRRQSSSDTKKKHETVLSWWVFGCKQSYQHLDTTNSIGFNIQESVQMHHECPSNFCFEKVCKFHLNLKPHMMRRAGNSKEVIKLTKPDPPQSWFGLCSSFHHSAISGHQKQAKVSSCLESSQTHLKVHIGSIGFLMILDVNFPPVVQFCNNIWH